MASLDLTTDLSVSSNAVLEVSVEASENTGNSSNNDIAPPDSAGLSKSARKRLFRAEMRKSTKKQKRKDLKERKRSRKEALNYALGLQLPPGQDSSQNEVKQTSLPRTITEDELTDIRRRRKEAKHESDRKYLEQSANSFAIVIDCNWEEHHNDRALASLSQQIYFSYGLNRRNPQPAALYLTGVGPLLRKQLEKQGLLSWMGLITESRDYIQMPQFQKQPIQAPVVDFSVVGVTKDELNESYQVALEKNHKQLVYLSSDADETLDELDPNCAYVIGGIVDRNRLKGITHKKAMSQQLRTVKLPIRDHLELSSTHVLTVNHCLELLLERRVLGDWPSALNKVIPPRKMGSQGVQIGAEAEEHDDEAMAAEGDGHEDEPSEDLSVAEEDEEEDDEKEE